MANGPITFDEARAIGARIVDPDEGCVEELMEHGPDVIAALLDRIAVTESDERALRVIIEGRTVPPTDAEIEAHARADAGGLWRWVARVDGEVIAGCSRDREEWCSTEPLAGLPRRIGAVYTVRWWALDADGRPCAWPVVTEAPRG